jgi:23S rRNA pseudouridine2605 synthase
VKNNEVSQNCQEPDRVICFRRSTYATVWPMRINRFLAAAGLGSRRRCEELVRAGVVTINGQPCEDLSTQVSAEDAVKVRGKLVHPERPLHVAFYKPRGYVCTADDPHAARTIFELLPRSWPRVFYVGRLDKESEGLLLLTNDGDLAMKVTHPRHTIEKEYEVILDRPFEMDDRAKLLAGFSIEGGRAKMESVKRKSATTLHVVLRQGLKRQIRLMFAALGYEVKALCRTRIGPITLGTLAPGGWRFLTKEEIEKLNRKADTKRGNAEKLKR